MTYTQGEIVKGMGYHPNYYEGNNGKPRSFGDLDDLREQVKALPIRYRKVAELMGLNRETLKQKLTGRMALTDGEIELLEEIIREWR